MPAMSRTSLVCLLICLLATTGTALILVSSPSFMAEMVDDFGFNKIDDSLNWNNLESVYSFLKMLEYSPVLKLSNEKHVKENVSEKILEELFTVKSFHEPLFSYERLARNERLANVVFRNMEIVDYQALFTMKIRSDVWSTADLVHRSLPTMINSPNLIAWEEPLEILMMAAPLRGHAVSAELFLLMSPELVRKYVPRIEPVGDADLTWSIMMSKLLLFSQYQDMYPSNLHENAKLWLNNRMAGDRDLALAGWNYLLKELQEIYAKAPLDELRKRCTFAILDYIVEAADFFIWGYIEQQCAQALLMVNPHFIPAFKLNRLFSLMSAVMVDVFGWLTSHRFVGIFFADHIIPSTHRSLNHRLRRLLLRFSDHVGADEARISAQNGSLESLVSSQILNGWERVGPNNAVFPLVIMNLRLDRPVKINMRYFKSPKEVVIRFSQRLRRNLFKGSYWRVPTSFRKIEILVQMIPFFICHRLTLSLPAFPHPNDWSNDIEELAAELAFEAGTSPGQIDVLGPLIAERLIKGLKSLLVFLKYGEILQLLGNNIRG